LFRIASVLWVFGEPKKGTHAVAIEDRNREAPAVPAQYAAVGDFVCDAASLKIIPNTIWQGTVVFCGEVERSWFRLIGLPYAAAINIKDG
jgi:hypothetical protein